MEQWLRRNVNAILPLAQPRSSDEILSSTPESSSSDDSNDEPVRIRLVPHVDSAVAISTFEPIDREIRRGTVLELGRFSDNVYVPNRISFRSKVVSRGHAIIWTENGDKLYIQDNRSSSGTFVNGVRLSGPHQKSSPYPVKDGDVIQLGVDFRGGAQEIYRCVKMKVEINRTVATPELKSFSWQSYQTLKAILKAPPPSSSLTEPPECCICLYAIAPSQPLFVAPCQHIFHYKCMRPLLKHYPGFQCPLCRSYADLESSVALDTDQVVEMLANAKKQEQKKNIR